MDFSLEALGARLKAARDADGRYNQAQAAHAVHVSTGSYQAYEQGAREIPDATLATCAKLFGVHVAVLRYGETVLGQAANAETARALIKAARELEAMAARLSEGGVLPASPMTDIPPLSRSLATKPPKGQDAGRRRSGGE